MLSLISVEFRRIIALTLRYPANFISSLFISTLMFYGLFMGAQYLSNQQVFGKNLDAMIVGYAAWVLATKGLNKTPMAIQNEADTGVLESIFLSSYNKSVIFLARALSESLVDIVLIVIMVGVLVWITGSQVEFPLALALPTVTLVLAAVGLGMTMGALALQVKRVGAMLPSLQMMLLLLMFTPFETWTTGLASGLASLAMWLPMVPSVLLLRELMAYGHPFDPTLALKAVANGVGYVALSMVIFNLMAKRVRSKGLLAGY